MGAISATAVILSAMYLLTMYQKLMFGPLDKPENKAVRDIHGRETWVFGIVVAAALVMGLAPAADPGPVGEVGRRVRGQLPRSAARTRSAAPTRRRTSTRRSPPPRRRPRCSARCRSGARGSRAMTFDVTQLFAYSPMLILIGMGCVILLAETFMQGKARSGLAWLGVAGCVAALVAIVAAWGDAATPTSHFDGMLTVDRMALYLDAAFVVAALLTLLFAPPYLREQGFEFGEFYALVLFATAGMVMVVHATSLVSLLIGIETMSLAAYVLTGCARRSLRSAEGAMKYFLMGAFATGFLVYGIALVYGATGGELRYAGIAAKTPAASQDADLLPGRVLHPDRAGVQGRGRPLPHVGARRLRRGADAGHRLHGGGREGGRVRRAHPPAGHAPSPAR